MWNSTHKQLQIITDCKSIAELSSGRAEINAQNPATYELIVHVQNLQHAILMHDIVPKGLVLDLTQWRARTQNRLADKLAGIAAHHQCSYAFHGHHIDAQFRDAPSVPQHT